MLAGDLLFIIDNRHHGGKQALRPKGTRRPTGTAAKRQKQCKKETPDEMRAHYVGLITPCWKRSGSDIFKMGDWLEEAFNRLGEKEYKRLYGSGGPEKGKLPFEESVGRKLRIISKTRWLRAKMHALPPCWSTLYELTKLEETDFKAAFSNGGINPNMTFTDAEEIRFEASRNKPAINVGSPGTPPPKKLECAATNSGTWNIEDLGKGRAKEWKKYLPPNKVTTAVGR